MSKTRRGEEGDGSCGRGAGTVRPPCPQSWGIRAFAMCGVKRRTERRRQPYPQGERAYQYAPIVARLNNSQNHFYVFFTGFSRGSSAPMPIQARNRPAGRRGYLRVTFLPFEKALPHARYQCRRRNPCAPLPGHPLIFLPSLFLFSLHTAPSASTTLHPNRRWGIPDRATLLLTPRYRTGTMTCAR